MKKQLISTILLIAYCAILIKVMVFKDMPVIKIGHVMLNFAGTDPGHAPNFIPFVTIVPYLLGHKGLLIAGVNLIGNIALLVPIGFLAPLVYRNMTWQKSLVLGVASGLAIEVMQTVLRVGIFDIDDVILNALGVMIGYVACVFLSKWVHSRNYKNIGISAILCIAVVAGAFYLAYPWGQQPMRPGINSSGGSQRGDLCGGTGGNGQIVSVGTHTFTMQRGDGRDQIVKLTDQTIVETSAGPASESDLKIGDRVTLVGGPNPDGSFSADTVVICSNI